MRWAGRAYARPFKFAERLSEARKGDDRAGILLLIGSVLMIWLHAAAVTKDYVYFKVFMNFAWLPLFILAPVLLLSFGALKMSGKTTRGYWLVTGTAALWLATGLSLSMLLTAWGEIDSNVAIMRILLPMIFGAVMFALVLFRGLRNGLGLGTGGAAGLSFIAFLAVPGIGLLWIKMYAPELLAAVLGMLGQLTGMQLV